MTNKNDCWEPLEGTPECLNALLDALGAPEWTLVDVMDVTRLPPLAVAFILLYPTTDKVESYVRQLGPIITDSAAREKDILFVRQCIGGSCGSIAVLHALLNSNMVDSPLHGLIRRNKHEHECCSESTTSSFDRSRRIVEGIQTAHSLAAEAISKDFVGGLQAPRAGQRQGQHFITFISKNDELWILDGRREGPICRGCNSSIEAELQSVLDSSMNDAPKTAYRFSILALVKKE